MNTYRKFLLLKCIVLVLISLGCVSQGSTETKITPNSIRTPSPALAAKATAKTIPTIEVTPSPSKIVIPTLPPNQLERMVILLGSETCILPCYLGISPGKTSSDELKLLMDQLGTSFVGIHKEEGITQIGFSLWVGDASTLNDTPDPNKGVGDREISQDINIKIFGNFVQRIEVSIQTTRFISKYKQYWSRYLLRQILLQHGLPDVIAFTAPGFGAGYGYMIVYEKSGIFDLVYGSLDGNLFCPEIEKKAIFQYLFLTNPTSGLSVYPSSMSTPTERSDWSSTEEILGVNKQEFYDQLLLNPDVCFEAKTRRTIR